MNEKNDLKTAEEPLQDICKKQERHEEILEKATSFFSKFGYRDTDVQEIADAIGIGKGTIYRYFPTKKALFLASVMRAMNIMHEYVKSEISTEIESISRMKKAIKSYIIFIKNNPDLTELFVQERAEFRFREVSTYFAHREQRNSQWKEGFQKLLLQGKLRFSDFDKISDTISNLLYGMMFTKIFQEGPDAFEALANHSVDMIMYGLFTHQPTSSP